MLAIDRYFCKLTDQREKKFIDVGKDHLIKFNIVYTILKLLADLKYKGTSLNW